MAWPTAGVWLLAKLALIGCVIVLALGLCGEFSQRNIALARSVFGQRNATIDETQVVLGERGDS